MDSDVEALLRPLRSAQGLLEYEFDDGIAGTGGVLVATADGVAHRLRPEAWAAWSASAGAPTEPAAPDTETIPVAASDDDAGTPTRPRPWPLGPPPDQYAPSDGHPERSSPLDSPHPEEHEVHGPYRALGFCFDLAAPPGPLADQMTILLGSLRVLGRLRAESDDADVHRYTIVETDDRGMATLLLDGVPVVATRDAAEMVAAMEWHVNRMALADPGGLVVLHAGAVSSGEQVLGFPAPSGAGKSTLVTALVAAGFDYVTDEALALVPGDGEVLAYPKAVTLEPGSRSVLGAHLSHAVPAEESPADETWRLSPTEIRPDTEIGRGRLTMLLAPRFTPGATTTVRHLRPADTFALLVENAFWPGPARPERFDELARIARCIPARSIVYGELAPAVEVIRAILPPQRRS